MTILESSEGVRISVPHTHYQIACPFRGLQAMYRFIERSVPLKDVSQDKSKRVSKPTFFTKSRVVEINSYLTYS